MKISVSSKFQNSIYERLLLSEGTIKKVPKSNNVLIKNYGKMNLGIYHVGLDRAVHYTQLSRVHQIIEIYCNYQKFRFASKWLLMNLEPVFENSDSSLCEN